MDKRSFSFSKHSLLGVEGASVLAKFKRHPFADTEGEQIQGMARFISVGNWTIPVILIFGTASETVIKHESIHLCQWLHPLPGLLSQFETIALTSRNLIEVVAPLVASNPDQALDLLVRIVCHKTWTELEAYFWAEGKTGTKPRDIIKYAQRSAQPFVTFEQGLFTIGFYSHNPSAMAICMDRFVAFGAEMEARVPWVRELVRESRRESLLDAMWEYKEEDEMDDLFGPLDELA